MDGEFLEKLLVLADRFKFPLIIGLVGLLLIGLSFLLPKLNAQPKPDLKVEDSSVQASKVETSLSVDVAGEVNSPGVYKLADGARVEEAIQKAGGFTAAADPDWIAKELNLAAKVSDGQKIYIQKSGETSVTSTLGSSSTSSKININFASTKELDSLPGVGAVTIEKIISNRPYSKVDELLSKKVVGKATFEKLKDLVSVN